ncbi:unnamed protein product [Mucor hiemalis]
MHFSTIALATSLIASAFSAAAAEPITAIASFAGPNGTVTGTIQFTQDGHDSPTWIYANISGLTAGDHGLHVHQFGDLSKGCVSTGAHYNPHNVTHGAPNATVHHPGDLGNIIAQADGTAILNITSDTVNLSGRYSVIGRGVVVHSGQDDLGLGGSPLSNTTGNSGERVACGVIGFASVV